jgi:hypothetical protein
LALIFSIVLISLVHDEYIEYVEITKDTGFLSISYLAKWVGIALGLGLYLVFSVVGLSKGKTNSTESQKVGYVNQSGNVDGLAVIVE